MMPSHEPSPFNVIRLEETGSTNNYLKEISDQGNIDEFTVAITKFQTSGKGQRGNSWEAEKGKNLLFSILLYPNFLPAKQHFLLSQLLSVSIKEELAQFSDGFSIKWPNDIYWEEKKVCGILIENDIQGETISRSIGGIGININQKIFHSQASNPVSLYQIIGKEYDYSLILSGILTRIHTYYNSLQKGQTKEIEESYFNSLFRKNSLSLFADRNGKFTAQIMRVEPSGILVLQDKAGNERKYAFKEISYIL